MEIDNKVVLVTGASSGIGAAIARSMAEAGAKEILLLARREDALNKVADEIRAAGGSASIYPVDLSDANAVSVVAQQITTAAGTPDIIINNAGSGQWKFVDETAPEEAVQMMALPYFATFYITHAFLSAMLKRNSGHFVNISSVASRFVWPGATAYTAARWAQKGFTEALRSDLADTGIGVTLSESPKVKSEYWENNPDSSERLPGMAKLIPELEPEDVGKAVVKGVIKNKKLVVIPFMMKIVYLQHRFFPEIVQWLMTKTGYRR